MKQKQTDHKLNWDKDWDEFVTPHLKKYGLVTFNRQLAMDNIFKSNRMNRLYKEDK